MLTFAPHEKLSLKRHPDFNEAWVHERICDDPTILGLGEVRVLEHERSLTSGGRLDLLLYDDDNLRRYEVEVMLGATDPSHIIRCIEYWDLERRRYPAYEHVAVIVAEDITTRFLNVMSLFSGSIPLIAIQLDALRVGAQIILNFVHMLDQTELRLDDTEDDTGGGEADRAFWEKRAGAQLLAICDDTLAMINECASTSQDLNYLRGYIGLKCSGVVRNIMWFSPKPTKKIVHIGFRNARSDEWVSRFEQADATVRSKRKGSFRITVSPGAFQEHAGLIREAVRDTVTQAET